MANTKVTKILMRNGTQQEWINADSVAALEIGEIGFESDTYRMKIGNTDNDTIGSLFKDLEYFAAGIVSIQEVDATHENGLMIDADGVLELDIGNLVGRIDHHDSVLSDHADSIEALRAGFDTVSQLIDSIETDHHDSILILIDSITSNIDSIDSLNVRLDSVEESIDALSDSIEAIEIELDTKVSKAGDTMSGPLVFEGTGIVGTVGVPNLLLTSGSTFVNNLLEPRRGVRVGGTIIETNDSYHAVSEEDIVDVKSLKDINLEINEPVTKTQPSDGGYLFRSTSNPGRIGYRPSIPLKPAAQDALTSLTALPADSVDADDLRDILVQFFTYIEDTGVLTANDQVVYEAD